MPFNDKFMNHHSVGDFSPGWYLHRQTITHRKSANSNAYVVQSSCILHNTYLLKGALFFGMPGLLLDTPGLLLGMLGLVLDTPGLVLDMPELLLDTPGLLLGMLGLVLGMLGLSFCAATMSLSLAVEGAERLAGMKTIGDAIGEVGAEVVSRDNDVVGGEVGSSCLSRTFTTDSSLAGEDVISSEIIRLPDGLGERSTLSSTGDPCTSE